MNLEKQKPIHGREFDWFAVDGAGNIAHFSTAGVGPAPAAAIARVDEMRALQEQILQLPVIATATPHLPGDINDWLEMSRRGLFSYDWKHWEGPYQRAATPSKPITIGALAHELRELVQLVTLHEIRFADQSVIPSC